VGANVCAGNAGGLDGKIDGLYRAAGPPCRLGQLKTRSGMLGSISDLNVAIFFAHHHTILKITVQTGFVS
jgi:hypothetical protein